MNSFIDWLVGYLDDRLTQAEIDRIVDKYKEIEDRKFTDNVILPNLEEWKLSGNKMTDIFVGDSFDNVNKTF